MAQHVKYSWFKNQKHNKKPEDPNNPTGKIYLKDHYWVVNRRWRQTVIDYKIFLMQFTLFLDYNMILRLAQNS